MHKYQPACFNTEIFLLGVFVGAVFHPAPPLSNLRPVQEEYMKAKVGLEQAGGSDRVLEIQQWFQWFLEVIQRSRSLCCPF